MNLFIADVNCMGLSFVISSIYSSKISMQGASAGKYSHDVPLHPYAD